MGLVPVRTLRLLLVLTVALASFCPLAPAMPLPAAHKGQCQPERGPAVPHACCLSLHHEPALVRPAVDPSYSTLSSMVVVQASLQPCAALANNDIAVAASPPSPLFLALRI